MDDRSNHHQRIFSVASGHFVRVNYKAGPKKQQSNIIPTI
jgi:hypothetical protein